jgi:hypothetical protein
MNRPKGTFYGKTSEGKIVFQNQATVIQFVASLMENTPIVVTIEQEHKKPSLQMYAYYQACICKKVSKETGYTPAEVDEILCERFLTQFRGTKEEYVPSKADITDEEMADLIDHSIQFCAMEWGIGIEPANREWRNS